MSSKCVTESIWGPLKLLSNGIIFGVYNDSTVEKTVSEIQIRDVRKVLFSILSL